MADHNDLGKQGEELAVAFLKKQNYKILATNWRFGKEEIDIIACDKNEIVFAEVKTRGSQAFGAPETFVSNAKQRFIINAADAYLKKNDVDLEARFDVISVIIKNTEPEINHIISAFYPII